MGLFDRFRKQDSVKDPFGGDGDEDFYEDEEGSSNRGAKIALAGSGVVFAGVVGFIAYVLLTAPAVDTATAPVTGSFADLEIVDEAPVPADAAGAPAAGDATAATDRSAERRPWLAAQPSASASGDRLGLAAKTKPAPAAKAAPPAAPKPAVTPPATTAAVTPPPAAKPAATPPVAAAKETQVAVLPPPRPSPTGAKPVASVPTSAPPSAGAPAAAAKPSAENAKPGAEVPAPAESAEETPSMIAGIPALNAPGVAPGAPDRFVTSGDSGPAVAGGRPRLVDPPLPPTDRVAVSAPPPRFAALRDVKKGAVVPPPATASKIAVVVRGLGLSQSATEAAITKLPPAVTLAFSPYARNLKGWVERAKAQGHEVLIEVPLESKDFPAQDPGPLGLLTTLEIKDNTERLDAIFKASSGAIGVFDAQGTKFRESNEHIAPLFAKLKEQNLFYVQGSPGIRVGEASVPTAVADVVIDERPFRAAIDARLDYAERLARYQGSAVAALNAKPVSFERLVLWMEQAQKKGIALAPISAVLIRSESPAAAPAPAAPPAANAKAKPDAAKAKPEPAVPAAAKAKAKT
ncbi:MAG: divergent polysaccharide deacetylase family protein [Rhodospirillaceae bacterium]